MNRAQRRAQKCQPARYTEADLRRAVADGVKAAAKHNVGMTFSAMCLSLHQRYGFGHDRCLRVLNDIRDMDFATLSYHELTARVEAELGIDLTEEGELFYEL